MKLRKASSELFAIASIFFPTPYIPVKKSLRPHPNVGQKNILPPSEACPKKSLPTLKHVQKSLCPPLNALEVCQCFIATSLSLISFLVTEERGQSRRGQMCIMIYLNSPSLVAIPNQIILEIIPSQQCCFIHNTI